MIGQQISFPNGLSFSICDSIVDNPMGAATYKIVNYIDTSGCTPCRMKIPTWNAILSGLKTKVPNGIELITVIFTKDTSDVKSNLQDYGYKHFVVFDSSNEFFKYNNLPSDTRMHTVLINGSNNIIAIGNPIENPQILDLYLKAMQAPNEPSQIPQANVLVSNVSRNIGQIKPGDEVQITFTIYNIGNTPLQIDDIVTSCECTSATWDKTIIDSGDSLALNISLTEKETGTFYRTVKIYCNSKNSPIELEINGEAK